MKKSKCDVCSKKVAPKVKKFTKGEIEGFYVRCSKCKTVYPAYIEDAWVREKKEEVEQLQNSAWGTDGMTAEEKLKASQRILQLQAEVEYVAKTLLPKKHIKDFEQFGERVFVR
jgi:uncharacterized Zn finger protein